MQGSARAFAEEIPDTTKLIIAQRVSSIQNADRIIVMDNGDVSSGFGTHEELLKTNAIYQEVFHSQIPAAPVILTKTEEVSRLE